MSSARPSNDASHSFYEFASACMVGSRLDLSDRGLRDEHAPQIIEFLNQHPHITEIDLSHNSFSVEGIKHLAKYNKTATKIELSYNKIGDKSAKYIAKHNKTATQVSLRGSGISDAGVAYFIYKYNKTITQLDLSDNNIDPYIMKTVNQQIAANKLYGQTWMKAALMMTSVRALNNNNSRKYSIYGVLELIPKILEFAGVEEENVAIKKGAVKEGTIYDGFVNTLFFKHEVFNQLPTGANKKGLRRIRDGFKYEKLKLLPTDAKAGQLKKSNLIRQALALPNDASHSFYEFMSECTVGNRLDLSRKGLKDEHIPKIIEFLNRYSHIEEVDLSLNSFSAKGAIVFAIKNKTVKRLNLACNELGAEGGVGFAMHNKTVKQLNLARNQLGAKGAIGFAMYNKAATQINLASNKINEKFKLLDVIDTLSATTDFNDADADAYASFIIYYNKTITQLDLSDNNIGPDIMKAVNQQIAANITNILYCQTWMKAALMMASVRALNNNNSCKNYIYGVLDLIHKILEFVGIELEFAGVEKETLAIKKSAVKNGKIYDGFVNTPFFKHEVFNQLPIDANKNGLRRIRDGFKYEELKLLPTDAKVGQPQKSSPTLCTLL